MRVVRTHNAVARFHASARAVSRLFALLDKWEGGGVPPGEFSVAFLDDAAICRLHADFLGDPSPTDVITFPADDDETRFSGDGEPFAGEICVCVPQARREAWRHGNTLAAELLLYLVHGWLHLAGHDDIGENARREMRLAERAALAYLREARFEAEFLVRTKRTGRDTKDRPKPGVRAISPREHTHPMDVG